MLGPAALPVVTSETTTRRLGSFAAAPTLRLPVRAQMDCPASLVKMQQQTT